MKRHPFLACLLVTFLLLSACQPTNALPAASATVPPPRLATSTAVPTVVPSPTPRVFEYPRPEWTGVQLENLCLQLDEVYDTQSPYANTEVHQEQLEKLLQELGIAVAAQGCDATLHLAAGYFTGSTTYSDQATGASVECVTSLGFGGLMVLTTAGRPALHTPVTSETGNSPYLTTSGCPDQSTLFDTAWSQGMLEALSQLLGPTVITRMYTSQDPVHRQAAFGASQALGPDDLAVLPDVIEALKTNTDVQVRASIASGIRNMGSQAQEAAAFVVPALLENLQTSALDPFLPGVLDQTIVETFGKLGPGAKESVPALLEMIEDPNSAVSADVVMQALGEMGPAAETAMPVLLEQARAGNARALEALGKIGPPTPEVVPALMEAVGKRKENFWMSAVALEALAALESQSPEVLPILLSAAQDPDPAYAEIAIRSLGLSGTTSPEAYQLLQKLVSSPKDSLQTAAIDALKSLAPGFGSQVTEMVPTLVAIARKQDMVFVAPYSAVDALSMIQKDSPEVIAAFNDILSTTHILGDFALENMGPESHELVPALIEALAENQPGGPQDISFVSSYIHALISITGEYPGYRAQDWQAWWDAQPQ
jgi:HEAT repeat protein